MSNQQIGKVIAKNRKARHEYDIVESFEAGIALTGTEVKSIRQGNINLKDSYAVIKNGELFLQGCHISPYEQGNRFNVDPTRQRKLLMHRREIIRLQSKIQQDGLTLIPLSLYFKRSKVKVELALARGKKLHDKREALIRREQDRAMDRSMKAFNREGTF